MVGEFATVYKVHCLNLDITNPKGIEHGLKAIGKQGNRPNF